MRVYFTFFRHGSFPTCLKALLTVHVPIRAPAPNEGNGQTKVPRLPRCKVSRQEERQMAESLSAQGPCHHLLFFE